MVLERQKVRGMGIFYFFVILRIKTFTLMKPKNVSKIQGRVFQAPDLKGMLQVFNGEECQSKWVGFEILVMCGLNREEGSVSGCGQRRQRRMDISC